MASQKGKIHHLLNGAVQIDQGEIDFRISIDAVLLGSVLPSDARGDVLDVGCGTGAVSLVLANRCSGLKFFGLEKQVALFDLARRNVSLNGWDDRFDLVHGDMFDMPKSLRDKSFDFVVSNPPFYVGMASPKESKAVAHTVDFDLVKWIEQSVKRVKPRGVFAMIYPVDQLDIILSVLRQLSMGGVEIFPIYSKAGQAANRLIVKARKGVKTPTVVHAPLVMHDGSNRKYSEAAEKILRDGACIADVIKAH